jgi:RimJ/RimL family protein N-acetyltransferase
MSLHDAGCVGDQEVKDAAIGLRLPQATLLRRGKLPLRVQSVVLNGPRVQLRPLDLDRDVESLHSVSNGQPAAIGYRKIGAYDPDELIWRYMYCGPFPTAAALREYLRPLVNSPNGLCLCAVDRATGCQMGVANFLNNTPEHLRIELGSIWYSPLFQGTGANTEAAYLMLDHAFRLGYRRVEWKCNARNERSFRAALRLGFRFEGIMHAYAITKGCNRDSAWFRMLDSEWPSIELRLKRIIAS